MKNRTKQSILDTYDSYEDVPAAVKAWITMRAKQDGKNPVMVHAGYKAAFSRIKKQQTITIVREEGGYLGGCCSATPFHHIIKARSEKMLSQKIGSLYDEILECGDKDSEGYQKAIKVRDSKISVMITDFEKIDIDGTSLQIISDSDFVTVR